ncbi:STM4012 family radical SAM protein [Frankia sp. AgB32]|uniref:STM4012 family radical SAM protein n=1 Tax=Frankia sp. AgB32 TaxID=631119 RepID=UPI00200CFD34|nr:STM4012 family radical SAM protein [Frankia sp. AgB32]MCK9893631.1 STM4012 family radical SAM protein [Frankia sp. AgB32]
MTDSPYQHYLYAYPHKTAYRPLSPPPRLRDVWAGEDRSALALYLHVPFCEMRCGFCNLFTRTGASADLTGRYLDALDRQATAVDAALAEAAAADAHGEVSVATTAIGGGTPTYLTAAELDRLGAILARFAAPGTVPLSVETSPATATTDRLAVLRDLGTTRVSMGVQSFLDTEARAAGRPQKRADVESALDRIRVAGFPTLNIDLIYGIGGQTADTWLASLTAALAWRPEELYLYPLYVRPLTGLTGLAGRDLDWDDQRLRLYHLGRDHLLSHGYEQVSMRMFRRPTADAADAGTRYCCQTDGMIGLGCGARSYTSELHYSFDYAVGARHVRTIIDDYVRETDFDHAQVGFTLDADERRRRHLIQSLLQADGLDRAAYRDRFHTDAAADVDLAGLAERGWLAEESPSTIRLSPEGLAHSDAIGPALLSARVRALMTDHTAR